MGLDFRITGANITDPKFPVLRDEEELTPGSLMLIDMTHSLNAAGVPVNGGTVYNVAWREAAAILGSGDASSLSMGFVNTFTSAEGVFERTSKGALHGVVSRTAQNSHTSWIVMPEAIKARLVANPTREMALFVSGQVTRVANNNANMVDIEIANNVSAAVNYLINASFANSLGLQHLSFDIAAWTGTPNATVASNIAAAACWGNAPAYNGLNPNDGRSYVLYRWHLIDVALSGKTYAQLAADNVTIRNKLFGAGGRYYGDTWTSPDTLIPS